MITVIDYGMGNLHSVKNALDFLGIPNKVMGLAKEIEAADALILPGVGAFPDAMSTLDESRISQIIREKCAAGTPLLGICLGMQLLFERSDENDCAGLGLMAGKVIRFPEAALVRANGERLKVPQMGWNTVTQRMAHPLWNGIADKSWFYFVHSYFVAPEDDALAAGTSSYGLPFVCAVARDNIFATQFHPEKSAASGLKIFSNFVHWNI